MVRLEGRGTALLGRLAPGDEPQWWGLVGAREVASDNSVGGWEVRVGGGRGGEVRYLSCHVMQVGQGGAENKTSSLLCNLPYMEKIPCLLAGCT